MPSNEKLITQITKNATGKGLDVPETEGKTNDELAAALKVLKNEKPVEGSPFAVQAAEHIARKAAEKEEKDRKAAQKAAATPAPVATPPGVKPAAEGKKPPYSIAMGRAITSRRGILANGDEITPEDLAGGTKALDTFVESGHIVKA